MVFLGKGNNMTDSEFLAWVMGTMESKTDSVSCIVKQRYKDHMMAKYQKENPSHIMKSPTVTLPEAPFTFPKQT